MLQQWIAFYSMRKKKQSVAADQQNLEVCCSLVQTLPLLIYFSGYPFFIPDTRLPRVAKRKKTGWIQKTHLLHPAKRDVQINMSIKTSLSPPMPVRVRPLSGTRCTNTSLSDDIGLLVVCQQQRRQHIICRWCGPRRRSAVEAPGSLRNCVRFVLRCPNKQSSKHYLYN